MSWHEHDDVDAEDLVARGRRGLLSPAEQATLARALEARPELETAYRVGVELDRAGAVQGGDEALIARTADAALARAQAVTGRASKRPARDASRLAVAAALALSLVSATGIATALWTGAIVWPFAAAPAKPVASPPAVAAAPRPAKKPRPRRESPALEQPTPAPEAAPEVAPEPGAAEPAQAAPRRGAAAPAATRASELFHAANSARRAGNPGRARRLYTRLIEAHPGSDEAGLARVSLGSLLLKAGDARGAERQFRSYLADGGQLSEEALVGQAQSSGQLRHTHAEKLAWQRLLASYPSSVYAAQARQRLAEIDATPHEGMP